MSRPRRFDSARGMHRERLRQRTAPCTGDNYQSPYRATPRLQMLYAAVRGGSENEGLRGSRQL